MCVFVKESEKKWTTDRKKDQLENQNETIINSNIYKRKKKEFNKVLSPLRVLMNVNPLKGHGNESK